MMNTFLSFAIVILNILILLSFTGRANNDLFKFDHSLRHLFPYDGKALPNLKELDDGSIQRVVSILRSNIKQWSFVESQLLEPNVNIGMPEIFIPLGHLTTTLEVLGNILFMRNDIIEAKECLERACPLMELLPANFNDGHHYTNGCFAVLREIYLKLYARSPNAVQTNKPVHPHGRGASKGLGNRDRNAKEPSVRRQRGLRPTRRFDATECEDDPDDGICNDIIDDEWDSDEDELADRGNQIYQRRRVAVTRNRRKMRMESREVMDEDWDENVYEGDSSDDQYRDSGDDFRDEDPYLSADADEYDETIEETNIDVTSYDGESNDFLDDRIVEDIGLEGDFDIDKRFEDLRAPFDHLRAELRYQNTGKSDRMPPKISFSSQDQSDEELRMEAGLERYWSEGLVETNSGIHADLEFLLLRFIYEDEPGRESILELAQQYYDELNTNLIHAPKSVQMQFEDDLVLSRAYLSVLSQVYSEGLSFVRAELGYLGLDFRGGSDDGILYLHEDKLRELNIEDRYRVLALSSLDRAVQKQQSGGGLSFDDSRPYASNLDSTVMSPLYWLRQEKNHRETRSTGQHREQMQGRQINPPDFQEPMSAYDEINEALDDVAIRKANVFLTTGIMLFVVLLVALVMAVRQDENRRKISRVAPKAKMLRKGPTLPSSDGSSLSNPAGDCLGVDVDGHSFVASQFSSLRSSFPRAHTFVVALLKLFSSLVSAMWKQVHAQFLDLFEGVSAAVSSPNTLVTSSGAPQGTARVQVGKKINSSMPSEHSAASSEGKRISEKVTSSVDHSKKNEVHLGDSNGSSESSKPQCDSQNTTKRESRNGLLDPFSLDYVSDEEEFVAVGKSKRAKQHQSHAAAIPLTAPVASNDRVARVANKRVPYSGLSESPQKNALPSSQQKPPQSTQPAVSNVRQKTHVVANELTSRTKTAVAWSQASVGNLANPSAPLKVIQPPIATNHVAESKNDVLSSDTISPSIASNEYGSSPSNAVYEIATNEYGSSPSNAVYEIDGAMESLQLGPSAPLFADALTGRAPPPFRPPGLLLPRASNDPDNLARAQWNTESLSGSRGLESEIAMPSISGFDFLDAEAAAERAAVAVIGDFDDETHNGQDSNAQYLFQNIPGSLSSIPVDHDFRLGVVSSRFFGHGSPGMMAADDAAADFGIRIADASSWTLGPSKFSGPGNHVQRDNSFYGAAASNGSAPGATKVASASGVMDTSLGDDIPISELSADAPSFSPSFGAVAVATASAKTLKPAEALPSTNVKISLTSNCKLLTPSQTQTLKIVSGVFGGWNIMHAMPMRRSVANAELWGTTLNLSTSSEGDSYVFEYKYIARDTSGDLWMETGPVRSIIVRNRDAFLEQEDVFIQGSKLA